MVVLREAVRPAELLVARLMVPVKPLTLVMVIFFVAQPPAGITRLVVLGTSVKFGEVQVIVILNVPLLEL